MKLSRRAISAMCLVALIAFPMSAFAQNEEGYKFNSLIVSSGEDPISSGITGIIRFENEQNRLIEVAFQHEQAWVIYGQHFNKKMIKGLFGASAGHFQGAPWAGPILTLSMPLGKIAGQEISARTMQWPGLFVWEPTNWKNDGVPNPNSILQAVISNIGLDIGPIGLTYTKLIFLDDPWNSLPGISYTKSVHKDFSLTGSMTRNINKNKWMFCVGLTWKPQ